MEEKDQKNTMNFQYESAYKQSGDLDEGVGRYGRGQKIMTVVVAIKIVVILYNFFFAKYPPVIAFFDGGITLLFYYGIRWTQYYMGITSLVRIYGIYQQFEQIHALYGWGRSLLLIPFFMEPVVVVGLLIFSTSVKVYLYVQREKMLELVTKVFG